MVISWITNSLKLDIAQSIMWMDCVVDIWKEWNEHYHQGDVFWISDLQKEICVLKQGSSSITNYFTYLKKLWQEMKIFRPFPSCSSTPTCSCNLFPKIKEYKENDYAIHFLKGLNEYPTVEIKIVVVASNSYHEFSRGSSSSGGCGSSCCNRGHKICTHCNKSVHMMDVRFKKHGYPLNYLRPNSGASNNCSSTSLDVEDPHLPIAHLPIDHLPIAQVWTIFSLN
ncbi:uncharacterized protein [Cicer arietinum]|uniref:uncharacterized protein n=1 Tax=Cicer arietinum TaxID=3827 RepID=UPI003CC5A8EA